MADISAVKAINGTAYTVRDYRVPVLPESNNVYLRGDGSWQIPVSTTPTSGVTFIDGGDHLRINLSS